MEESIAKETERGVYRMLLGKPYTFGALARLVAEQMEYDEAQAMLSGWDEGGRLGGLLAAVEARDGYTGG